MRTGFNLIGYASGNLGMGLVLRDFAKALLRNGYPIAVVDIDAGGGRSGHDMSLAEFFVPTLSDCPHPINIWILGADQIIYHAPAICADENMRRKFNAMFLWWELPDIPPWWSACARAFDAIIVGSEFVQQAWANAVSDVPVILAQHPLDLPKDISGDRRRFGIDTEKIIFYTGFEATSDPARKNPFAAVSAFQWAFPDKADVGLVIKVNNPGSDATAAPALQRLYQAVERDSRILIIQERLAYRDLLCLYASCDVVISLHRAEGLGLIPLEAMRLGKPVLSTGWSGNMTYMSQRSAALVNYDVVSVNESAFRYAPAATGINSRWAEPRTDHAAEWMRRLASDPPLRDELSAAALVGSLLYDSKARQTLFAQELIALRDTAALRPPKNFERVAALIDTAAAAQRHAAKVFRIHEQPVPRRWFSLVLLQFSRAFERHIGWRIKAPAGK